MARHDTTLRAVFAEPAPANLRWRDIDSLLRHLGAEVTEGSGSRMRVRLNNVRAVLHRPHPRPQATRPQVRSVRQLLENAGIQP